jgi:hypothetical protein
MPFGKGAYSCGAVAESHRFPEHPGDCDYGLCNSIVEPPELQEAEVDDISFIAAPATASQKRCWKNKMARQVS